MFLKKTHVLVAAFSVAAMVSPAVLAQKAQQSQTPMGDPLAAYRTVGINKEQESKLNALLNGYKKLSEVKSVEMRKYMTDMRNFSLQADPDEPKILAKQAQINKLNSDMSTEHVKMMVGLRKVLTPEQRKKLIETMKGGTIVPAGAKIAPAQPKK